MIECVLGNAVDLIRATGDGVYDAIVTDPPYGIDYQSKMVDKERRRPKIANDGSPYIWWLHDAYRVLKDVGCLVCFHEWRHSDLWRRSIEAAGFKVRLQIVWDKQIHGMADPKRCVSPSHELVWFATKGKYAFPGARPSSVFSVRKVMPAHLEHPNEQPVPLMEELLRAVVPPGGSVLDPFAGSGSTLVAAKNLGMHARGFELDLDYCTLANRRLEVL